MFWFRCPASARPSPRIPPPIASSSAGSTPTQELCPTARILTPRALNTKSPQSIDTDASNIRLDDLGARDKIFAQHAFTNQKVMAFESVAGQNPDTNTKSHNARLTWNHLFSVYSFIDSRSASTACTPFLVPEPNAVGPQATIGTSYQTLGPSATIPVDRRTNHFAMPCSIAVSLAITCSPRAAKSTVCRTMASRHPASAAITTSAPTSAAMSLRTSANGHCQSLFSRNRKRTPQLPLVRAAVFCR